MQWQDKVTIVTGGASGIGAACCCNFAARNAVGLVKELENVGGDGCPGRRG